MDIVTYCTRKVLRSDIPRAILEDAFLGTRHRLRREPVTIESRFREEIFDNTIKQDLNSVGGTQLTLVLSNIPYTKLSNYQRIYKIPTRATGGRRITQAHLTMLNLTSNFAESLPNSQTNIYRKSTIDNSSQRLVNNNLPIPNRMNAEVEMLGENVLKINDWQNFTADMNLVCLLEYSENLSEIKDPYFPVIAKLALLATKGFIYRELALLVDKTRLEGGRDFGRYREFIDEYRDAQQQYDEYLDSDVYRVMILSDQNRKQRHIQTAGKIVV